MKMNIKIKSIEFDFTGGGKITKKKQQEIIQNTLDAVWKVEEDDEFEDEDELTDYLVNWISNETGWLIDALTWEIVD
jgi:hypothetical protein